MFQGAPRGTPQSKGRCPMGQHPLRRSRPQQIHMIEMGTTCQHRRHQHQHLTSRIRSTHPTPQPHHLIHRILQSNRFIDVPATNKPASATSPASSENHPKPVNTVRHPPTGSAYGLWVNSHSGVQLLSHIRGTFHVYSPPAATSLWVDRGLANHRNPNRNPAGQAAWGPCYDRPPSATFSAPTGPKHQRSTMK